MKNLPLALSCLFVFLVLPAFAFSQTGVAVNPQEQVNLQLNKFSPLAEIIVRNLGMEDKNGNGVIEKESGEGYEEFIEKYGIGKTSEEKEKTIDCGFYVNYVSICANNKKLEENEIVNHYYSNIRFAPNCIKETESIEKETASYIYANNIPLAWLDDEQGTVKNAVNNILGEGWDRQTVTEDEAVRMFYRTIRSMTIAGRTGEPTKNGGYYTLPEFIAKKAGYCVEAAQFGFWFFSELKINALSVDAALSSSVTHEALKLASGKIIDYFGSSTRYNVKQSEWHIVNPLQALGLYYRTRGGVSNYQSMLEQGVLYDKNNLENHGRLMNFYYNSSVGYYKDIIIYLGEYFIINNDIDKIINATHKRSSFVKNQIKIYLIMLFVTYNIDNNKSGYDNVEVLLRKYYSKDALVKDYLDTYRVR